MDVGGSRNFRCGGGAAISLTRPQLIAVILVAVGDADSLCFFGKVPRSGEIRTN